MPSRKASLLLPGPGGELRHYTPCARTLPFDSSPEPFQSRVAFAAAHVVCDPLVDVDPLRDAAIDWDTTLAYRRYLWSQGLAVAEAMDTAQRGMGLDWIAAQELVRRSLEEARVSHGRIACGAGTDHLQSRPDVTLDDVIAAYEEQVGFVESAGGQVIMMASRALASSARHEDDYEYVYDRVLSQVRVPVILHWLGEAFDPALRGYWGHPDDVEAAMAVCLRVIREHADRIDGVKISLLDSDREIRMRRLLPAGVRMYTGDDFNYLELIEGDNHGHSDALLGIFDPIAPVAAAALRALDRGDRDEYRGWLGRTVPLARHIFRAPTYAYKTGVVFMAYLNGHQEHFRMIAGAEGARSIVHLAQLFVLADEAGLLLEPDRAVARMQPLLELAGVAQ